MSDRCNCSPRGRGIFFGSFFICSFCVLVVMGGVIGAIIATSSGISGPTVCSVDLIGIRLGYNYANGSTTPTFVVDFNVTTMQANYVFMLTIPTHTNTTTTRVISDPYKIDQLTPSDYNSTAYNMLPIMNTGNPTVITNVIPASLPIIHAWENLMATLASKYPYKLIFAGCDYINDTYVMSSLGNRLYLPTGCFWIVFDSYALPATAGSFTGNMLDYAYYSINGFNLTNIPKRIFWTTCL